LNYLLFDLKDINMEVKLFINIIYITLITNNVIIKNKEYRTSERTIDK